VKLTTSESKKHPRLQEVEDSFALEPTLLPLSNELLPTAKSCMTAGCSGQLCVDASFNLDGMITTCQWREEYACYQAARCEVQENGHCGFTWTSELENCLSKIEQSD
jgi:hypothetical protein